MTHFGVLLAVLLFLGVQSQDDATHEMVETPFCSDEMCDCEQPNVMPGDLSHIEDGTMYGCYCACGRASGVQCHGDGHCARGFECVAPHDFSAIEDISMGVCQDRCTNQVCPQYFKCRIVDTSPECYCDYFQCSEDLQMTIEASRTVSTIVQSTNFMNSCAMTNANCKLYTEDPSHDLWFSASLPGEQLTVL